MLLKIREKIIRENVFERKKKKPGLNLTLGLALIGLLTTGPWILGFGIRNSAQEIQNPSSTVKDSVIQYLESGNQNPKLYMINLYGARWHSKH